MSTLIEAIEAVLQKYSLSDRQFCLKLDIEPSTWHRVKTGEINPSAKFLSQLSNRFPELDMTIMLFLKANATEGNTNANTNKAEEEPKATA